MTKTLLNLKSMEESVNFNSDLINIDDYADVNLI